MTGTGQGLWTALAKQSRAPQRSLNEEQRDKGCCQYPWHVGLIIIVYQVVFTDNPACFVLSFSLLSGFPSTTYPDFSFLLLPFCTFMNDNPPHKIYWEFPLQCYYYKKQVLWLPLKNNKITAMRCFPSAHRMMIGGITRWYLFKGHNKIFVIQF